MPTVSVVMACYNMASTVRESIESVLAQTYQDFEIVVADDGSTDGSGDIVAGIPDSRIRLCRLPKNVGGNAAGNVATELATGRYIAHLGADDIFERHKLAVQIAFLESNPGYGAVFSFPRFIDESGQPYPDASHHLVRIAEQPNRNQESWLRTFFWDNCLFGATMLYRREVNDAIGFFDERLRQLADLDWYVRLVSRWPIYVMQEPLTRLRIRSNAANVSARRPDSIRRHGWELEKIYCNYEQLPAELFSRTFAAELQALALTGRTLQQREAFWWICLNSRNRSAQRYALDALYRALPPRGADSSLGFTAKDLHEFSGRLDISGGFPGT